MTRNNLIFGGVNSKDFGVWISGSDTYSAPERDTEHISVPGRNGDLIIDNGRWKNKQVTYPAFFPYNFPQKMESFRSAICRKVGYQRLEDSYHPDEYRMAEFVNGITPTNMAAYNKSGDFSLTFNCKPQRYLKTGDEPIQLLPPVVTLNQMRTTYIPVNGSLTYTVHCNSGEEIAVQVETYDVNGNAVDSSTESCYNGDSHTKAFTSSDKYFRIILSNLEDIDSVWLEVSTITSADGNALPISAVFARTWFIHNPTGYEAVPLIETFHNRLPFTTITNYVDGEMVEYYEFNSNVIPVNHYYMDCELQYLYDDDKQNLTNYLLLTTATSAVGKGLVFPKLGTDEIKFYLYYTTAQLSNGLGLIQIYPRWWKL